MVNFELQDMHESKQMQWSCQLDEDDIIPDNIKGTLSNVCSSEENTYEISKTCAGD
jgi:hypothetical protein